MEGKACSSPGERPNEAGSHVQSAIGQIRDVDADQHAARSAGHTEHPVGGDDDQEPT